LLNFDINAVQLQDIINSLQASEKQIRLAVNRAISRTAASLRVRSSKGLQKELQLRSAADIRRRLKTIKVKKSRGTNDLILWFGANDLPISALKGSARKTEEGASFRDKSFSGAFISKNRKGKQTIFKRLQAKRLPVAEQTYPVADKIQTFVEDEIFSELPEIFFKFFEQDLRARTIHGAGNGRR